MSRRAVGGSSALSSEVAASGSALGCLLVSPLPSGSIAKGRSMRPGRRADRPDRRDPGSAGPYPSPVLLGTFALFLCIASACGRQIVYKLTDDDITKGYSTASLRVAVAELTEARPAVEKAKRLRSEQGQEHARDYTDDSSWRVPESSSVTAAVSEMVVEHLRSSEVFAGVAGVPLASSECDSGRVRSFAARGVDAILCGELEHFYGLAEDHEGKAILITIGGLGIGGLAYLAVPQPVTARTRMSLRLVSTEDSRTIWSGVAEGSIDEKGASAPTARATTPWRGCAPP